MGKLEASKGMVGWEQGAGLSASGDASSPESSPEMSHRLTLSVPWKKKKKNPDNNDDFLKKKKNVLSLVPLTWPYIEH